MPILTLPQNTTTIADMADSRELVCPRAPLELSGALNAFHFEESTPMIGREYLKVDIVKDILDAENGDALVRDLAITSMSRYEGLG